MPWLPALILSLLALCPLAAAELADETVRYVNDQVISLGDVMQRNQERISVLDQKLKPSGMTQWMAFSRGSLEEITEEELLIQYAKRFAEERHFQLLDHERITQQVLERAKASGRTMTLREQAMQRKVIERKQAIEFIMGFLELRAATIGPAELLHDYQSRAKDFYRPPRAKVLEIVLRPTGAAEQQEVRQAKLAVFKRCQEAKDPELRKAVESRLDAFLAGTPDVQQPLVAQTVAEVAAMATRTDLDLAGLELVRSANQALVLESRLRDGDAALQPARRHPRPARGQGRRRLQGRRARVQPGAGGIRRRRSRLARGRGPRARISTTWSSRWRARRALPGVPQRPARLPGAGHRDGGGAQPRVQRGHRRDRGQHAAEAPAADPPGGARHAARAGEHPRCRQPREAARLKDLQGESCQRVVEFPTTPVPARGPGPSGSGAGAPGR